MGGIVASTQIIELSSQQKKGESQVDVPVLNLKSERQVQDCQTLPTEVFDLRLAEELDERIEYTQWKVTVSK